MKKLLILQLRPEEAPVNDEYRAFLEHGKINEDEAHRIRLSETDLPRDLDLDDYYGVILGGGPQNFLDKEDLKDSDDPGDKKKLEDLRKLERNLFPLTDQIIEKDFPFLGACLGIGLLTTHQKGVLSSKYKEEVAAARLTLTDEAKEDALFEGIPDVFHAVVGHKEACEKLPPGAKLLVRGDNCPNQLYRIKENVYATQFHPELDLEGTRVRVAAYDGMGYFKDGEGEAIIDAAKSADLQYAWKILENFVKKYRK